MVKKYIQRHLPDHEAVRSHRYLRMFGTLLHDPNLWHLNRRSVSGGFAVGLFMAFLPIPFQMVAAAGAAIALRVNLPLSVALVWLTNPVTIPPVFYFAYRVGAWILRIPPQPVEVQLSFDWLLMELEQVWQPLLLGSLVCGVIAASVGYAGIRLIWRLHVLDRFRRRRARRRPENRL